MRSTRDGRTVRFGGPLAALLACATALSAAEPISSGTRPIEKITAAPAEPSDSKRPYFPGEGNILAALDRIDGALKEDRLSTRQIEAREALVEVSYAQASVTSPGAQVELLKAQRKLASYRLSQNRDDLKHAAEALRSAQRSATADFDDGPSRANSTATGLAPSLTAPPAPEGSAINSGRAPATTSGYAPTPSYGTQANYPPPPAPAAAPPTVHHHHYGPAPAPVEEVHVYPGYYSRPRTYYYGPPVPRPIVREYHYLPPPIYVPPPGISVGGPNWRMRFNF